MTENQRQVYLLLCQTGRSAEAAQYQAKCDAVTEQPEKDGDSGNQYTEVTA